MQQNFVIDTQKTETLAARRLPRNNREQRLGHVEFSGQAGTVPCSVREFSREGAVLTMSGWMGVPDSFSLYVEPDGIKVTCAVMRKRGSKVQVSFTAWENATRMRSK